MERSATLRIYLAGDLLVERASTLVRSERFPGAQGRLVFAMLASTERAVRVDELADELWGDVPPRSHRVAIRSLVSKVRLALMPLGSDLGVEHTDDAYRLLRPSSAWIDLVAAQDAIHRAEAARSARDLDAAIGWGRVSAAIGARPFLPGADGGWATAHRRELIATYLRALEHLAGTWLDVGAADQAARDALRVVGIDPFREPSLRLAMRALVADGDRASALREYERFRVRLRDALGVDPSPETQELHVAILRGTPV